MDTALVSSFGSHDGFTRAFVRQFNITPQKYSRETPGANWFVHHPIEVYYVLERGSELMPKERVPRTVTTVERPARKLIFLRYNATDYFSVCEEVGYDWEGFFNSIPEAFTSAAGGRLPQSLFKPETSDNAFFVEVSLSYNKPLPDGYEIDGIAFVKCNGGTFEFRDPTVEQLPDYLGLFEEFHPIKR